MLEVGIDAIGFYSSRYFLDLKTLAEKRGIDVSKILHWFRPTKNGGAPAG